MDATQKQREAEFLVHMNFGRAYGAALEAQNSIEAPQQRKEAAANMLATATATTNRDPVTMNHIDANNGRMAMEKAYKNQTTTMTAILSGRVADYDLPKGFEGTQDLTQLASKGQMLAQAATRENYASRGIMTSRGNRDDYMALAKDSQSETVEKLTTHMLHVKSSIETAVDRNNLDRAGGDALYKRFQNTTFNTAEVTQTGQNLKSPAFSAFEKAEAPRLRDQVLFEVETRYALQKQTVEKVKVKENLAVVSELNTLAKTMEAENRSKNIVPATEDPHYINQIKGLTTVTKALNNSFQAANTHVSLPIGSKMILSEHKTAVAKLGGEGVANIELPKQSCAYTGKIIQASDTHIIQQVSPTMAIAHDISKLSNSKELLSLAEQGKLRNANLKISYNDKQGEVKPITLNKEKVAETMAKAKIMADTFARPQSRDAFLKHVEKYATTRQEQPNLQKIAAPVIKAAQPTPQPGR